MWLKERLANGESVWGGKNDGLAKGMLKEGLLMCVGVC